MNNNISSTVGSTTIVRSLSTTKSRNTYGFHNLPAIHHFSESKTTDDVFRLQNEISNLKLWIENTGQPAVNKLKNTEIKLEKVESENIYSNQKIEVLHDHISQLKDDAYSLSRQISDYESSENIEDVPSMQLFVHSERLATDLQNNQEKYSVLNDKYSKLKKDNECMKDSMTNLSDLNSKYFEKVQKLLLEIKLKHESMLNENAAKMELFENNKQLQLELVHRDDKIYELEKINAESVENSMFLYMQNKLESKQNLIYEKTLDLEFSGSNANTSGSNLHYQLGLERKFTYESTAFNFNQFGGVYDEMENDENLRKNSQERVRFSNELIVIPSKCENDDDIHNENVNNFKKENVDSDEKLQEIIQYEEHQSLLSNQKEVNELCCKRSWSCFGI